MPAKYATDCAALCGRTVDHAILPAEQYTQYYYYNMLPLLAAAALRSAATARFAVESSAFGEDRLAMRTLSNNATGEHLASGPGAE